MKDQKFIIERNDGRFYGSAVWTFDQSRAVHFPTRQSAERKSEALSSKTEVKEAN